MDNEREGGIPAGIRLGPVTLIVRDGEQAVRFYTRVLGLQVLQRDDHAVTLGAGQAPEVVRLEFDPQAERVSRTTGLYHMAVRVPGRRELAYSLRRIAEMEWPLQGVADHGVSEALYLADPEGNGIEVYRDRPRTEWPFRDGKLQMVTDPLDLNGLLAELPGSEPGQVEMAPGTEMGHVHLKVNDLHAAEDFYVRVMGFDLVQRYGSQAGFVSAGGYHHHVGFNTWSSAGAPPKPEEAAGLDYFGLILPSEQDRQTLLSRLEASGHDFIESDTGWLGRDPAGNGILLRV